MRLVTLYEAGRLGLRRDAVEDGTTPSTGFQVESTQQPPHSKTKVLLIFCCVHQPRCCPPTFPRSDRPHNFSSPTRTQDDIQEEAAQSTFHLEPFCAIPKCMRYQGNF